MKPKFGIVKAVVAAGLVLVMTAGTAFASVGTAKVTASALRLRSAANSNSEILALAPMGSDVELLSTAENGWYKVNYAGKEGYMSAEWLNVTLSNGNGDTTTTADGTTGVVTDGPLNIRSGPGKSYNRVGYLMKGDKLTILATENGWHKITVGSVNGYVSADYVAANTGNSDNSNSDNNNDNNSSNGSDQTATQDQNQPATVAAGPLNVRSGPGTSYKRIGSLNVGASLIIHSTTDGWYQITCGDLEGYVSAQYVTLGDAVVKEQVGLVSAGPLNVRSGPGTGYSRVGSLSAGTYISIHSSSSGWYKISYGKLEGYVSASYVTVIEEAATNTTGMAIAAMAKSLVGCPYSYSAAGPNAFDCSGLSYYICRQLGYSVSRGSSQQYKNDGAFVSLDLIEPGDLVFFFDPRFDGSGGTLPTTHMGIYVGDGQFIHASTTTYRVQYDNLFSSYYTPYIVGAKRIS